MSGLQSINNGYATLASGISAGDTNPLTISLTAGHGARHPPASSVAGTWYIAALINEPPNKIEFIKVYNRSTDTLTALRAWGGTTAQDWSSNDRCVAVTDEMSAYYEQLDLLGLRNLAVGGGGSVDALTASLSTGHTVLTNGMRILLLIYGANEVHNPTLNLTFDASAFGGTTTATGALPIVLPGNNHIGIGALQQYLLAELVYNANYGAGAWVLQNPIGGIEPPGTIKMYAGSTLPPGAWFWADGSVKAQASFSQLYAQIGNAFNRGDEGGGNFRLPDLRGRVAVGAGTGTVVETVTNSAINTTTYEITVASNIDKIITGMRFLWNVSGTPPTTSAANQLDDGDTVYAIRVNNTTIKLASSLANAQNGTAINITNAGSGTFTLTHTLQARMLGVSGGEEAHAMSLTEMLAHTHPVHQSGGNYSAGGNTPWDSDPSSNHVSGSRGGNAAMNIMQPFLGVNYIIRY